MASAVNGLLAATQMSHPKCTRHNGTTHLDLLGEIEMTRRTARGGRQQCSVTARYNAGHASSTDTWSFPIQGRLKGDVKITTGYGEILIDYNWRQNTIGAGILLVDWL